MSTSFAIGGWTCELDDDPMEPARDQYGVPVHDTKHWLVRCRIATDDFHALVPLSLHYTRKLRGGSEDARELLRHHCDKLLELKLKQEKARPRE